MRIADAESSGLRHQHPVFRDRLDLLTFLRVVSITGQLKAVPADPDDDKVLECAVVAAATHVVTGDRRHLLPMGAFQGIRIITAAEFLKVAVSP